MLNCCVDDSKTIRRLAYDTFIEIQTYCKEDTSANRSFLKQTTSHVILGDLEKSMDNSRLPLEVMIDATFQQLFMKPENNFPAELLITTYLFAFPLSNITDGSDSYQQSSQHEICQVGTTIIRCMGRIGNICYLNDPGLLQIM